MLRFILTLLGFLITIQTPALADGKLETIKKQLESSKTPSRRSKKDNDEKDEFDFFADLLFYYFVYTFSDLGFRYRLHPYQGRTYIVEPEEKNNNRPLAFTFRTGFQFIDNRTSALFSVMRLRIPSGSSFSFHYILFSEKSENGEKEYLSFYNLMQRASLFHGSVLDLTIDFGGCHFPGLSAGGFSWGAGLLILPQKPLVFDVTIHQHLISTNTSVLETDIEIGFVFSQFELMFGWRLFRFYGWSKEVDLSGFCFSFRVWF